MIGGQSPGKSTDVKLLNCLNMLSNKNSADRNDNVEYMADDTEPQYFLKCFEDFVEMYGETYLTRWQTP